MAFVRDYALRTSVTIVGPPFEGPTHGLEYCWVFSALAQQAADGLLVSDEPENVTNRSLIIELA